MTDRAHDERGWDAAATAYALSALEPDEEAQFVSHLATCARCTETVREAIRTVGDLAYAVPDEQPPPALKQRLMTAVALTPRDAVPPPRTAVDAPGRDRAAPEREPPGSTVVPLRRRVRRWQWIATAAAVLAVVAGLAGWNAALRADQHRLRQQVAQMQQPGRLVPLDSDGTHLATLVVRPGAIEVISQAMPANAPGTRYWLWSLAGPTASPVPIGGFDLRTGGPSVQNVRSNVPGTDTAKAFAVSVEPGGGTPTKPTRVLASGTVTG
jgi:anti-sigma-K factor RskA